MKPAERARVRGEGSTSRGVTLIRELWSAATGFLPHKVTCYENADKAGILYLRWRAGGNWKRRSLGVGLRDAKGRIRPEIKRMALAEADRQYAILSGTLAVGTAPASPLTIEQAWALVSDPKTGLYPVATRHTKQVARELGHAARIWGTGTPWDTIDRSRLRMLGRTRVDEIRARDDQRGLRGAVETVTRVLTVAAWLRDEGKIATDACLVPRKWKNDLREYWRQVAGTGASADPVRPRHTLEEMRRLLEKAPEVDPRFALLMAMGADLRLGQVRVCRRSDLSVEHKTLTVRSAGKKKGVVVELTAGQWAAWERAVAEGGYLSRCELALADYPLFPQGRLIKAHAVPTKHGVARPIDRTAIRKWFAEAEELAEIPHVEGRGPYGLRRIAVDAAKEMGISREGLQALGGWTSSEVPDNIYAEQGAEYARAEAARVRAKMRGEEP